MTTKESSVVECDHVTEVYAGGYEVLILTYKNSAIEILEHGELRPPFCPLCGTKLIENSNE